MVRKIFSFVLACVLLGVSVGLVIDHFYKETQMVVIAQQEEVSIQKKVDGLVACLSEGKCLLPRTVETINGVKILGVYLRMTGINFKYTLQDGSTLGIVVVQDNNNQVTLYDEFQKGVVTKFFSLNNGVMKFPDVTDSKHGDQAREAQEWYDLAMEMAQEHVVPKTKIKPSLRTQDVDTSKDLNRRP